MPTPTGPSIAHRLASALLGVDLGHWIKERRLAGIGWRRIAAELSDATNREVSLSHETLRTHYSGGAVSPDRRTA